MRGFALILALLIASTSVSAPLILLAEPAATVPATGHVKVQQTETTTETTETDLGSIKSPQLKQTAGTIRDLIGFLVAIGGFVGGGTIAAIKGWRAFKAVLDAHEKRAAEVSRTAAKEVAATAVKAASQLATVTSAQMQQVQNTIQATADQVSAEGDNTLRAIVQRHGEQIQEQTRTIEAHDRDAVASRREMMETLQQVKKDLGFLNETMMRVLTAAAIEGTKKGTQG